MYTQTSSTQNDVDGQPFCQSDLTGARPQLSASDIPTSHPPLHTMGMTLSSGIVCSLYTVLPARPQLLAYISTGRWQGGVLGDKLAGLT